MVLVPSPNLFIVNRNTPPSGATEQKLLSVSSPSIGVLIFDALHQLLILNLLIREGLSDRILKYISTEHLQQ
jgi:hypothetical protein